MEKLTIVEINERIDNEYSKEIADLLTDQILFPEYIKSKAVKKKLEEIKNIMKNVGIEDEKIEMFFKLYTPNLIQPGVKGNVRGHKFNLYIKDRIEKMELDENRFVVKFEKRNKNVKTGQIPDWYIEEKTTRKVIIGMNQVALWGGGHQNNRGDNYLNKYIEENKLKQNKSKFLSVVCNHIKITRKNTDIHNLLDRGFRNETLCYINNLENIIRKFFSQEVTKNYSKPSLKNLPPLKPYTKNMLIQK